jgi:hypothetical protein
MNNQEAQLVLQAYRLGGQDAADPLFHGALEQVKRDAGLALWFSAERAIETRVQARLKAALKPPAHLKASLLAQRKMVRRLAWWQQPLWLTAAAAIVLLGAAALLQLKPSSELQFASFRQAMVQNARQMTDHVTFVAQDVTRIKQWLKDRDIDTSFELPVALRDQPAQGCRVVDWNGRKVTLICFMLNGKDHVDLFVLDATHFRDFTPSQTPRFAQADGLTTAAWTKGNRTYLVASTADETVLRKYF